MPIFADVVVVVCRCGQCFPVAGAVASGLTFMTYTAYRACVYDPDTHFDRSGRSVQPYERKKQGDYGRHWVEGMHSQSRWDRPGLDVGKV